MAKRIPSPINRQTNNNGSKDSTTKRTSYRKDYRLPTGGREQKALQRKLEQEELAKFDDMTIELPPLPPKAPPKWTILHQPDKLEFRTVAKFLQILEQTYTQILLKSP